MKQASEDEIWIENKENVTARIWGEFRARRVAMPVTGGDKEDPSEDQAALASKRKAEWKRRQGVCIYTPGCLETSFISDYRGPTLSTILLSMYGRVRKATLHQILCKEHNLI